MTTINLPEPDTHCFDDDSQPPKDVWSYSPELARQIIDADRAQRGEPVLWRYRDSEQCIKPMDGYTPGEGWTPLYTAPQPSQDRKPHTEAQAAEIAANEIAFAEYRQQCIDNHAEIERLRAESDERLKNTIAQAMEIERLRADAERYRWLAKYLVSDDESHDDAIVAATTVAELDYVIDAAMKGTP